MNSGYLGRMSKLGDGGGGTQGLGGGIGSIAKAGFRAAGAGCRLPAAAAGLLAAAGAP